MIYYILYFLSGVIGSFLYCLSMRKIMNYVPLEILLLSLIAIIAGPCIFIAGVLIYIDTLEIKLFKVKK